MGTEDEDDETLRHIISEADRDGDGQISFIEFKDMMLQLNAL